MYKGKPIFIPIILVLGLVVYGIWYLVQNRQSNSSSALAASGTIEVVEVIVSPELSGRVVEVFVDKGDKVQVGDPLLRMDDALLQSQRELAATALEAAEASLSTAQTGLEAAQSALDAAKVNAETVKASTRAESLSAQKALNDLNQTADVARADAERAVAAAHRTVREATYLLDNYTVTTEQQGMTAAEAVEVMKQRLDEARQAFELYKNVSESDTTREDLKEKLDEAQSDYDAAIRRLELESAVQQAQARLDKAITDLEKLQEGPDPDNLAILEARIVAIEMAPRQAEAAVQQAEMGVIQAESKVDQAASSVPQAQAQVKLIDTQLQKLTVFAASSGIVLSRDIQPGEVVQAGARLMVIGELDQLKITVYIPEDRYGQIQLNQSARVTVDSFPSQIFNATVVYIADQSEFTPRNVQTAEGRRTTVFAIELAVENQDGKLKPGMPADVEFDH